MKHLILFEGIASSGKTTLERMLCEQLRGAEIVTEGKTLMPIFENKDPQKALAHLVRVLDDIELMHGDTIIVDRFHLTWAFRTESPLSVFRPIEDRLLTTFQTTLVLLHMQERLILSRIQETDAYRAGSWVKKKQGTYEERTAYYVRQQAILMDLVKQSRLSTIVVDTSDKDWSRGLTEISQNHPLVARRH